MGPVGGTTTVRPLLLLPLFPALERVKGLRAADVDGFCEDDMLALNHIRGTASLFFFTTHGNKRPHPKGLFHRLTFSS